MKSNHECPGDHRTYAKHSWTLIASWRNAKDEEVRVFECRHCHDEKTVKTANPTRTTFPG